MADRETVITHLQIIHTWAEFARERDLQFFTPKHLEDIAQWADDAIAMLKGQEAVEPVTESSVYDPDTWFFVCGSCKKGVISPGDKFCPWCGRAVKWE